MRLLTRGLHVRQEIVEANVPHSTRLLYASDLHLGLSWTRSIIDDLVNIARDQGPNVVLLGGDLVENRGGLAPLHTLVRGLREMCPHIYAVAGNHDHRVGVPSVRDILVNAGAHWLDSATHDSIRFESEPEKLSASSDYRVLVAHDPAVFARAADAGFDLVLAGHLHGGQCVLFSRGGRMYPGALFARYTGLRFARGRTTMLVSRGAGDTLPLRWNCPREVILCTIQ
jgi:predicted MPP superfamily phosphohydrolase